MEWKPRMWPTFAAEVLRARASLRIADEVGLAFRAERQRLGLSQRAYAAHRGLTLGTIIRLESAAESLKLGDVDAALEGTMFQLCLCHRPPDDDPSLTALPAPTSPDGASHDAPLAPSADRSPDNPRDREAASERTRGQPRPAAGPPRLLAAIRAHRASPRWE